ncbi:MAG: 16S rRNA (guanine(527)-N(7))-methyltransferase RsmG [Candidatus Eremiobacteraeota bacterium]|nr:16S rRNA (guanine(527)-N(7))-methyltransferase RsmG [Candidatus Eremiobacteraeota bacterium]
MAEAGVAPPAAARIAAYGDQLLTRNSELNLTGAKTADELIAHLLDSLTIAPLIGEDHVDIGSGGGLPAIPAALLSGVNVLLLEARAKKAAFLAEVTACLGMRATVVAARAEDAARDAGYRERFSTATARAVGHPATVAELTLPFLQIGGRAILQRGIVPPDERAALDEALLVLGGRIEDERDVGLRHRLIIVAKIAPTPGRFPRRAGMPAKKPLGTRAFHGKPTGETE